MAITTLQQATNSMRYPIEFMKAAAATPAVGRAVSYFYTAGRPGAAVAPTPGLSGAALTSYAGQIPFTNPVSGETRLGRLQAAGAFAGTFMLCDRLWHNSGMNITATTAQTINSVTFPARDANGSTDGEQVYVGVEVSTATGAGTPSLSMSYTNQAGTAGRTGTNMFTTAATAAAGSFYEMGLANGDTGVRSIQTFTLSATWTSGTIHLVAYRVLARLELTVSNITHAIDWVTGGAVKAYDNTVPFIVLIPSSTSNVPLSGHIIWTQG